MERRMRLFPVSLTSAALLLGVIAATTATPAVAFAQNAPQTAAPVAITLVAEPAVVSSVVAASSVVPSQLAPSTVTPSFATAPHGVGVSRYSAPIDSTIPPLPAPANNNKGNTALMLTGVAAVIVGAIVGGSSGTLIVVGGAIIGGFGLYRFLNN
jgi:hypothetical protein